MYLFVGGLKFAFHGETSLSKQQGAYKDKNIVILAGDSEGSLLDDGETVINVNQASHVFLYVIALLASR